MNTAVTRRLATSLLLLSALLLPSTLGAQHFPADEDLELMLRFLVEDGETTGVVLGILEADGTTRILHYGSAGPDVRPLAPRSVFEIGSLAKTFTATLLAEMVGRGEVTLEDPVARHLPEQVTVPSRDGREITLLDLATHTSGLPPLPDNFRAVSRRDPYADYTVEMLYAFLSSHELRRAPGKMYEYSNVGYGILGHALARAAGRSYRELLRERVLEPLGMEMTRFALEGDVADWMVRGHRYGGVVPYWSMTEAIEGAGGLRSNVEDLLKYLQANVGPPGTDLERAMRMAQEIQLPRGEEGAGQGLAWRNLVSPAGTPIVEHGGATGGFQARLSFMPDRGIGSVVLTNEYTFRDALGMQLLHHYAPPTERARVPVASEVLAQYVGEYDETSGHGTFYVRMEEEGYLTFRPGGQVRARLYATSDTTFYLLRSPWSFTFRRVEGGQGVEMLMEVEESGQGQQGLARSARRVGKKAPRHRRPSPVRDHRSVRNSRSRQLRR